MLIFVCLFFKELYSHEAKVEFLHETTQITSESRILFKGAVSENIKH